MKKREIKDRDAIIFDIRNALSSCEDAKYYHRLDLVMLAISGVPIKDIADLYGEPKKTISTWTKKVIEEGVDSLRSGIHPGRPTRLTSEQMESIDADLQKSPEEFGCNYTNWDGIVLSRHINDFYGVMLKVRQCQRIIRQLGYTLQRPQTKPYGGNPEQQAEFKKNS